ncbi:hypothetical protein [Pararhizobium haloflavum]|uniref:hypothetical protein n=1 Tax=Pararhizobium haloflavum TaxID=2037914 RepID=UPI000C1A3722|nr:hypothetical protein [Pararhizobium haloflavum]
MAIRETVQETTSDVFEAAEDRLGALADKAYESSRDYAETAVREQTNAFKQFCKTIVRALRTGGGELRQEGYATVAGFVDDVAAKADDMTDHIDDFDMRSTTERVEDFVRERPLVAYGALAIAGFLVANTLQSASTHRHEKQARVTQDPPRRAAGRTGAKQGTAARTRARSTTKASG